MHNSPIGHHQTGLVLQDSPIPFRRVSRQQSLYFIDQLLAIFEIEYIL